MKSVSRNIRNAVYNRVDCDTAETVYNIYGKDNWRNIRSIIFKSTGVNIPTQLSRTMYNYECKIL